MPAKAPSRSTRKKAGNGEKFRKRESEVIDAAIKVFFRRGYSAASIQDVADEVGVLKGSLYYYIDSKEDLLSRIFDESHRQAAEIIEELSALDAPPLGRIRLFVERYVTWYLKNFERTTLYFNEWRHLTGERRKRVLAQRQAYDEFVRDMVVAAQDRGEIDSQLSPKYASFLIHGAVNSVSNWYRRGGADTPEQIANVYGVMLVGMLTGTRPVGKGVSTAAKAPAKRSAPPRRPKA
ncbi:MAG: TetR/AcrR family transcriptional regulator [Acidimicrobiia bacterium]